MCTQDRVDMFTWAPCHSRSDIFRIRPGLDFGNPSERRRQACVYSLNFRVHRNRIGQIWPFGRIGALIRFMLGFCSQERALMFLGPEFQALEHPVCIVFMHSCLFCSPGLSKIAYLIRQSKLCSAGEAALAAD